VSIRFRVGSCVLSIMTTLVLAVCACALPIRAAQAKSVCANEQLRAEQPYALQLPDCRAYEMVSPLEKGDSDATLLSPERNVQVASSGEAITYDSQGIFADPQSAMAFNQYVSRREPNGWSTQSITPPFSAFSTTLYDAYRGPVFTPDLSKGVASTDVPLTSEARAGFYDFYVADVAHGSYRLVADGQPGEEAYEFKEGPGTILGASRDLSDVVFQESGRIEEWIDGRSSLVGIAPNGEPMPDPPQGGGGQEFGTFESNTWRAVSADGMRVFMTSPGEAGAPNRQLYVRENNTMTVDVSASQRTDCADHSSCSGTMEADPHGPQSARYWGANVDGSRVFFTSCEKLTDDSTAVAPSVPTEDHCRPGQVGTGNDLYEYDLENGKLRDITVDGNPGDIAGAAVLGVVYISVDGSYVYFVAEGDLSGGNILGQPVSGQPNLYVSHNGGTPSFIATLVPAETTFEGNQGDSADWASDPGRDSAVETPDGTHIAFLSTRSLTGYDNTDANTNEPDAEVFSYDADTGTLVCGSCNPSGARPLGSSTVNGATSQYGDLYTNHSFSGDGSRLFFQSDDALVAHDSNGRPDVYEYGDGHVYPVSDVAGNFASVFLDASPGGTDVFIATADQLVSRDTDFRVDIYDARVGGGFPVSASPQVCENGDSCKPPLSPQPGVFGAPASATFAGAGNLGPQPVVKPAAKHRGVRLTRAQKLASALHACKSKPRKRRALCAAQAKKRYGAQSKVTKGNRRGN
jgi:hypothetical protein